MKVIIDPDVCMGCGICEGIEPDLFELGSRDVAIVKLDPVPEKYRKSAEEALDQCPEQAISIQD